MSFVAASCMLSGDNPLAPHGLSREGVESIEDVIRSGIDPKRRKAIGKFSGSLARTSRYSPNRSPLNRASGRGY